jgi:hypothetical protein
MTIRRKVIPLWRLFRKRRHIHGAGRDAGRRIAGPLIQLFNPDSMSETRLGWPSRVIDT